MAHQFTTCLSVLACILATSQAVLEKTLVSDVLLGGAKKAGVSSHLERILQVKPEMGVEESAGARLTMKSTPPTPTCTGDDCLVAPMPNTHAEDRSPLLPQLYGPMTQESYERMVMRKRAALRARLQREGRLTNFLDSFLQEAPAHYDPNGIPIPAAPSDVPADPPRDARADFEMRFKPQSPAPQPTTTVDDAPRVPGADFEMTFDPAAPAPQSRQVDTTAAKKDRPDDLRPAASPESAGAWHVRERLRAQTTAAIEESARRLQQHSTKSAPGRPPMTEEEAAKLDPQQAADLAARRRTADAVARRRAGTAAGKATASGVAAAKAGARPELLGLYYGAMPASSQSADDVPVPKQLLERPISNRGGKAKIPDGSAAAPEELVGSPDALYTGPDVAAQHRRRSDIERVLMVEADESAATPQTHVKPVKSVVAADASDVAAARERRRMAAVDEIRRQRAKAEALRAAGRWEVLDYVCVAALFCVVPAAAFMGAAVLEELLRPAALEQQAGAAGRPRRQAGTPLLLHWCALTHCLWRRIRRAFAAARKHLTGHASDLPTSANEGAGSVARAFNAAAGFMHVFWTHLYDLRHVGASAHTCNVASASATAAGVSFSSSEVSFSRTSGGKAFSAGGGGNPFSGLPQGQEAEEAVVLQADDTATAMAELQLRRRH